MNQRKKQLSPELPNGFFDWLVFVKACHPDKVIENILLSFTRSIALRCVKNVSVTKTIVIFVVRRRTCSSDKIYIAFRIIEAA